MPGAGQVPHGEGQTALPQTHTDEGAVGCGEGDLWRQVWMQLWGYVAPWLLSVVFGKAAGTVRAPGSSWDPPDLCVGCSPAWLCLFSFLCQHLLPKAVEYGQKLKSHSKFSLLFFFVLLKEEKLRGLGGCNKPLAWSFGSRLTLL